ncbi:tetratricopeptide repeat protein [Vibrio sp.]|nr:tetratricopeptide repeat protein [Vibrio sp.]
MGSVFTLTVHASELSSSAYNTITKAQQLVDSEQIDSAIDHLEKFDGQRTADKATIARILGVYYWQNDQLSEAVNQLEFAIANKEGLPISAAWLTEKMLADLYLNTNEYQKAKQHYQALLQSNSSGQSTEDVELRIAQSHYQLEEWKSALTVLNAYWKRHPHQSKQIAALTLALGSSLNLELWELSIQYTKLLRDREPKQPRWWKQLARLQVREHQYRAAMNTLSLARIQNIVLNEQELILLSQLYARNKIPEKAAITLEDVLAIGKKTKKDKLTLLKRQAAYWQQAKEWLQSAKVWGEIVKIDSSQLKYEISMLNLAGEYRSIIQKLENQSNLSPLLNLSLVRALYKEKRYDQAVNIARQVHQKTNSEESKQWVDYLSQQL